MSHNIRCENAHPDGVCKCSCEGKLHGINHPEYAERSKFEQDLREGKLDGNYYGPHDQKMTNQMGGEVAEFIRKAEDRKVLECPICGATIDLTKFVGYPHDGGLKDGVGNIWWVWVLCPSCKNQWSWHKLEWRFNL